MKDHQVLALLTAALLGFGLLAGCGATRTSAGSIPIATSEQQPPASTGAAPRVSRPIESEALTSDVCATLSDARRSRLGVGEGRPRTTPVGPSCSWKFVERDTNRVDISAQLKNPNGMSDLYDQESKFEYFEPTEVSGFPALYASIVDHRTSGDCSLHVALNDRMTVAVSASMSSGPQESAPCPVAESVAEAMLATLEGR
ncbi:DUF3558 domain-containing protein [Actinomycetes bacterium KLBMP 9759]